MLGQIISLIAANSVAGNVTRDLKRDGYLLGTSLPEECQGVEQEKAARKEEDRKDVLTVAMWCVVFILFLILATLQVD